MATLGGWAKTNLTNCRLTADSLQAMTNSRVERVVLETENHRIVGDLSLPKDGYLSRLSDYLNRDELIFVPLTNAIVAPRNADGPGHERGFIAVSRLHIQLAYPDGERAHDVEF
jgi:hypothetical protein